MVVVFEVQIMIDGIKLLKGQDSRSDDQSTSDESKDSY